MFAKSQAEAKAAREAAVLTGGQSDVPAPMTWDEAFKEAQRLMSEGPQGEPEVAAEVEQPQVARRPR